jgi:hypothetical protein
MLILGLLGIGALFGAFDAEDASERTFDLFCAAGAALIIATWAIANRGRRKSFATGLRGPMTMILIYTVAMPALAYVIGAYVFHLGTDGKQLLTVVVGLAGLGLAVWRLNS